MDPERQMLLTRILDTLEDLERSEDIVICSATPHGVANKLYQTLRLEMLNAPLSGQELRGLGELVREVLYGGNISPAELATRTGLSPQEFEASLGKLPHE